MKTITSQTQTRIAKRYGVMIEKDPVNGLTKNSAVLCTADNEVTFKKNPSHKLKKIGEVSDKKMFEVLQKIAVCNRRNIQTRYAVNQKGLAR